MLTHTAEPRGYGRTIAHTPRTRAMRTAHTPALPECLLNASGNTPHPVAFNTHHYRTRDIMFVKLSQEEAYI